MCDALHARDLFRRARDHDLAAGMAALGPEIDDVVGGLDHVHVMLDQEHGVPGVDQLVQRREQPLDVGQVQAGGRLVEDVDRVLRPLQLAQLGRDLDALRLAAGQRRRRLAERQVAEAEIVQDLDLLAARRARLRRTSRLPRPTCSARRRWSCRGASPRASRC